MTKIWATNNVQHDQWYNGREGETDNEINSWTNELMFEWQPICIASGQRTDSKKELNILKNISWRTLMLLQAQMSAEGCKGGRLWDLTCKHAWTTV